MFKFFRFLITHGIALGIGFALGIYFLPVLIAPEAPSDDMVMSSQQDAVFSVQFIRDLPGSDFLHWGEGHVSISPKSISFMGSLAPGPDYQLYLAPLPVYDELEFLTVKSESLHVGEIKTFDNFILELPADTNPADYRALVVWCETFGEFITAASYR